MTCVVAYVDENGKSHMAADSIGCDSSSRTQMSTKKIFPKGSMLFGFCGDFRAGQIVQYYCRFPTQVKVKDDMEYLITDVVPVIQEQFKANNYSGDDDDSYGFVVILNGNIYEIEHPFQVIPHSKKYAAVGSGRDFATAYMYARHEKEQPIKDPQGLIEGAIKCASEFVINVGGRIDYIKK